MLGERGKGGFVLLLLQLYLSLGELRGGEGRVRAWREGREGGAGEGGGR